MATQVLIVNTTKREVSPPPEIIFGDHIDNFISTIYQIILKCQEYCVKVFYIDQEDERWLDIVVALQTDDSFYSRFKKRCKALGFLFSIENYLIKIGSLHHTYDKNNPRLMRRASHLIPPSGHSRKEFLQFSFFFEL